MSSILKALRKLEDEKAALGEGRVDLARDILKRSAPQRDTGTPLSVKIVFFAVLAIALVAGLRLMLGSPDSTVTVVAPVPSPVPVPVPVPVVPVSKQPLVVRSPAPKVVQPEMESPAIPQSSTVVLEELTPPEPKLVPPLEPEIPADLPELRVVAIAFKADPGQRLAVVNDLPVMEGTSLGGVQIVEILQEGVRFSWQGTEFVLPVSENLPLD